MSFVSLWVLFKCQHTSSVKIDHEILLLFASGEFCLSTDGNMNEQVVGHVLFVDYPPFQLASLPLRMQNTGQQYISQDLECFALNAQKSGIVTFMTAVYSTTVLSFLHFHCINNGNTSEWSPLIPSVIIRVIVCPRLQTELDATEFCYRLIITMRFFKIKIKDIQRVFCQK